MAFCGEEYAMKLVIITNPSFLEDEAEVVTALFDVGLEKLHLRKPGAKLEDIVRFLEEIPERYRSRITIHEFFELKERFGLGGIHLNARHPVAPENYKGGLSCSCHTIEEVAGRQGEMDYLFLSPIFDSISKEGYTSGFTKDMLCAARSKGIINRKTIALGGVCKENLRKVELFGFGGAALLGDVWNLYKNGWDKVSIVKHFLELKKVAGG